MGGQAFDAIEHRRGHAALASFQLDQFHAFAARQRYRGIGGAEIDRAEVVFRWRHPAQPFRCPSGSAAPAFTSPSEKLVCTSLTLGSLKSVSIDQRE